MKRFLCFAAVGVVLIIVCCVALSAASVPPGTAGDLNGDGAVDIGDASLLLQHSLFPKVYPLSYAGDVDFDGSGSVNIADVVRLLRYSMFPEVYPLVEPADTEQSPAFQPELGEPVA